MPPYVVQPGDTLSEIAERFGSTVDAIVEANGLADPDIIFAGQILCVPPRGHQGQVFPTEPYIVQPGDTLSEIAEDFGLSVDDLVRFNRIRDPDVIFVGQIVCAPLAAPGLGTIAVWIVRPGDTLSEIGERFGVSAEQIAQHNGIRDPDLIFPGQRLRIPNPDVIGP
ncbi:MAG TPA: LysM peptidoglycan-binding domain-containing protein [Rubrobacteraceae bacterium]|jgi:LysM repeat protein|nr:LysM peptidoglycan-binding domain-containing protein [Rubrobacteraceae bacterium]